MPDHTYSWDVLRDKVLGEKMACLEQFFVQFQKNDDDDHRGNSMLYNLTDLLRNTRGGPGQFCTVRLPACPPQLCQRRNAAGFFCRRRGDPADVRRL